MVMIDTTTQPCPVCDSTNIRWRGRRLYDVPLTWARHFVEMLNMGASRQAMGMRRSRYADYPTHVRAEALQGRTGLRTATRFWRCRDCKNRGEVFDSKPSQPRVEDRTRPPS